MTRLLIAIVLGLSVSTAANANTCVTTETVNVGQGYFSGHHLREMRDLELGTYAIGFMDALAGGNVFGMNPSCLSAIQDCNRGRSGLQLAAIIRKYLKENPEHWHVPAHGIAFSALLRQCLLSQAK